MARDAMRTVARLRAMREEEARRELAAAAVSLARARDDSASATRRLHGHDAVVEGLDALRRERTVGVALRECARRSADELVTAERSHVAAAARWRQRRADRRAVARLLERRDAAALVETRRAEQAALDELALLVRAGAVTQ